ncbi:MAG: hypothetical protein QME81_03375, partial [bacterium]|nr:hypothetical protein [bacterium]
MAMQAIAKPEVRIPLYYDRFLDERERRFVSEIARLEGVVKNGDDRLNDRIDELKEEIDHRFEEAKQDRNQDREEMNRRFEEAKQDRNQDREEMNRR